MAGATELKKAYARGYAAGRKRVAVEQQKWDQVHEEIHGKDVARQDAFFCAALTGLLASPGWKKGDGGEVKTIDDYIEIARKFARKSVEQMPRRPF